MSAAVHESLEDSASDAQVEDATRLAWSGAHGAAMLWLDGPLRSMGKRKFMHWVEAAMDQLSRSIARHPG